MLEFSFPVSPGSEDLKSRGHLGRFPKYSRFPWNVRLIEFLRTSWLTDESYRRTLPAINIAHPASARRKEESAQINHVPSRFFIQAFLVKLSSYGWTASMSGFPSFSSRASFGVALNSGGNPLLLFPPTHPFVFPSRQYRWRARQR